MDNSWPNGDSRPTIAIIDDDPMLSETIGAILEEEGYVVSVFNSGTSALAAIRRTSFNIIILDLILPDFDGITMLREFRRLSRDTCIIISTGHATIDNAIQALNRGADAFLTKPFHPDELKSRIQKALENQHLIAEKRRLERELVRSEEKYRVLVEGIQDGMFMLRDGRFEYVNQALCDMAGYSRKELLTLTFTQIVVPEEREKLPVPAENSPVGDGFHEKDLTLLHRDGTNRIEVSLSQGAIRFEGNTFIIGTVKDMTERKRLERRLLQAEKLKALGEMASGISHDFNNLLSAILGRAQLMKMKHPAADVKAGLDIIEDLALDGSAIVRRIQDFNKTRPGAPFLNVMLRELVEESVEITRPRWRDQLQSKGVLVRVTTDFHDESPIQANPAEIKEVIMNLIINAIDAMPTGGDLTIRTGENTEWVSLSVVDTGCGISEDIKHRIFAPFFTTKGVRGDGLGLSIAYGIVSRHGGEFIVRSRTGEGSDFTIRFPVAPGPAETRKPDEKAPRAQAPRTILVMEDEENTRQTLSEMLTMSGYRVITASRGEEGLERLDSGDIHLVITDLGMPGMSGWQVIEHVKKNAPGVPTILMTGWGHQVDPSEISHSGVDEIVCKPFKIQDLLKTLDRLLSPDNTTTD